MRSTTFSALALIATLGAGLAASPAAAQWRDLLPGSRGPGPLRAEGQVVVTGARPASFEAARAASISEVRDGDNVWIAIRTNEPLSRYAAMEMHAGQPETYELQIDIRSANDERVYRSCYWILKPEEATSHELVLGLTPAMARAVPVNGGRFTRDSKLACWLNTVADDDSLPGRWQNRVALVSMNPDYRAAEIIAAAPLTANVPNGFPIWNRVMHNLSDCSPRERATDGSAIVCER